MGEHLLERGLAGKYHVDIERGRDGTERIVRIAICRYECPDSESPRLRRVSGDKYPYLGLPLSA